MKDWYRFVRETSAENFRATRSLAITFFYHASQAANSVNMSPIRESILKFRELVGVGDVGEKAGWHSSKCESTALLW